MSDESMDSVLSDVAGVDAEVTWENVEDSAPSAEEVSTGSLDDEWDAIGSENTSAEESVAASSEDSDEPKEIKEPSDDKADAPDGEEAESTEEVKEENKALSLDEMPDDTKIMAKVDGELQEITLKEFKNGISGEKAIAKRFSEYNVKEKEFTKQMDDVNTYINELGVTMRTSSILEGVTKIGELTGMPSYQIKELLIKELLPEIEARYTKDDMELDLDYQRQENEYLKNKTESDNKSYKAEQAKQDLESQVRNVRETHNINDEEWQSAFSKLDKELPKDEIITPELVKDYVTFNRAESRADLLINSFDSSFKDNSDVMDAFIDSILENPNFSDEDFMDILKTSLGNSKKEEAEKKVEAKAESKEKKAPTKKVVKKVEAEDFDDWEDIK